MKHFQAFIAAAITTAIIALGMLAVGVNAASNPNSVPVSDSPAASTASLGSTSDLQNQIGQMQNLIQQYQDREQQYQTEISNVSQQLSEATAQVEQLQQVLVALQQRGVIQISRDGRIFLPGG